MTDKLVTHDDLDAIKVIERECANPTCSGEAADLLRRLRAAAEADAPPLPEGWVVHTNGLGTQRVYWHKDGVLYNCVNDGVGYGTGLDIDRDDRDRLAPLRPAVTEADVEKAAMVLYEVDCIEDGWPLWASEAAKIHCRKTARAALAAVGIEVSGK